MCLTCFDPSGVSTSTSPQIQPNILNKKHAGLDEDIHILNNEIKDTSNFLLINSNRKNDTFG